MAFRGIVKGNVVVLDDDPQLPDGLRVVVTPENEIEKPDFDADPFLHVDEWAPVPPDEAPSDLAQQHDHYLYGVEKQ